MTNQPDHANILRQLETLSLAVLFSLVVSPTAQAQTLKETVDWMQSTLQPSGLLGMEQNGASRYSVMPGYLHAETIKKFSYEGCKVTVVKLVEDIDPALFGNSKPSLTEYTENFSLADIDPATITHDSGDGDLNGKIVVFSTTNDKKTIHCSAVNKNPGEKFGKDAGCLPPYDNSEQLRFSTPQYTARFAKALKHAVQLCGGKPSTF
jgi:hypothetical protein